MFRAVLFDYFNTLTSAVRRGSHHTRVADVLGVDPVEWVQLLDRTYRERASGGYGTAMDGLRRLAAELGARPSRAQLLTAIDERVEALRQDGPLRPEAGPLLRRLRQLSVRTAVVSDCWFELPVFLPRLPIAPLCNTFTFSIQMRQTKPHPSMYLNTCDRLDVDPRDCLYVGDGGSMELTGAALVGMSAVQLAAPDLGAHLTFDAEPDWLGPRIDSLAELERLVDREPMLV